MPYHATGACVPYVHSSLICGSQNQETTRMSNNRKMDTEKVANLNNGILLTFLKNKDILSFADKCMELENIILNEETQSHKEHMQCMNSLVSEC